jgi:hypothetical protein
MNIPKKGIFTPNVKRGIPGERYRLYLRGDYARKPNDRAFSITPDGPVFRATVEPDDCGLGCKCAAFITPVSPNGYWELEKAERF